MVSALAPPPQQTIELLAATVHQGLTQQSLHLPLGAGNGLGASPSDHAHRG